MSCGFGIDKRVVNVLPYPRVFFFARYLAKKKILWGKNIDQDANEGWDIVISEDRLLKSRGGFTHLNKIGQSYK